MADSLEANRERVIVVAKIMLRAVQQNYRNGPQNRDRVYEALNALASVAAHVINATAQESAKRHCRAFFLEALEENINLIRREPNTGLILPH